jgi:hypothetical protein
MKRRIKVVLLKSEPLRVEMFYLELDIFSIEVSDEEGIVRSCPLFADSFRHARQAFTSWLHTNYPLSAQGSIK